MILTRLQASIKVMYSYSSRPFLCALGTPCTHTLYVGVKPLLVGKFNIVLCMWGSFNESNERYGYTFTEVCLAVVFYSTWNVMEITQAYS